MESTQGPRMTTPLDNALRQLICEQAEAAALRHIRGEKLEQIYEPNTDAGRCFKAAFERFLLLHSAPDADGGA